MKIGIFFALLTASITAIFAHDKSIQTTSADVEVLSWYPRIFVFHQFLSEEECDYLVDLATPHLSRSTVVAANSKQTAVDKVRTSLGMFLPTNHNDPIIMEIEKRISLLTLMPEENGENIQVLYYPEGGEYKPHYDYFDPKSVGGAVHYKRGGQRVASFLMYLNTPEEGGETVFPLVGVKITPIKGDALLFYDCTPDGLVDQFTLHGGAPVLKGEKWLATRWLRQYIFK